MKINIEFLIVSYIIGLFVDWIFQSHSQGMNKSNFSFHKNDSLKIWFNKHWGTIAALTGHSIVYSFLTTIITLVLIHKTEYILFVQIILYITHFIIDSRIPVKLIMLLKGMTPEQIKDTKTYGYMHIGIDHRLHEMVLLVLSLFIH